MTGQAGAAVDPETGLRVGNWNNLEDGGPNVYGDHESEFIYFDDGAIAPGVTIEWAGNLDSTTPGNPRDLKAETHSQFDPGTDQDRRLFEGYLASDQQDTVGVNVSGLSAHYRSYDIYVYLDADDGESGAGSSVRRITDGTTEYFLNDPQGNTFTGTYVQVTSTTEGTAQVGNYVVFTGLTSDVVSIRVDDVGGGSTNNNPAITAVQVVGHSQPIDRMESIDPSFGGDDIILTGGGADIAVGGLGADLIETFGEAIRGKIDPDVVVGDNARATFMLGELREIHTTDPEFGGDDTIRTGNGEDLVLGGSNNDTIDTGVQGPFDYGDVTILSVNFNSGVDVKSVVTGVAGVVQADNWNNLSGGEHTIFGDEAGESVLFHDASPASDITIEWGRVIGTTLNEVLIPDSHDELINPDTQNERLFEGYLITDSDKVLGVNISGLAGSFDSYDVYVYLDADDEESSEDPSVRGITDGTTTYFLNDPQGNTFAGEFMEVTSENPNAARHRQLRGVPRR